LVKLQDNDLDSDGVRVLAAYYPDEDEYRGWKRDERSCMALRCMKGFEVSLVRAANRQTVELALDGAVQFGIVHVLAHGVASLTASVLDFGGARMSEAELVSLMSSQKTLQFVFLACCNGYEAAGGIHNAL
jgi:hypothetical protein